MRDTVLIPLGTDFEIDLDLMAMDQALREVAALAGQTLTFFLAATVAGAAIDATLSVTLTDLGAGRYYGVINGSDISAKLTTYVGQRIYPRLSAAGTTFDGVFADADYIVSQVAEVDA